MTTTLHILIVGGYGAAGQAVAEAVSLRLSGPIRLTVAGRDGDKAATCRDTLRRTMHGNVDVRALRLDATHPAELHHALEDVAIVIWCAPLNVITAQHLVDILPESGTDCVDLAPGGGKYGVLREADEALQEAGRRYVIDAGADPGLPGWMAHLVAAHHHAPRDVSVVARYRDRAIGAAGIADILDQMRDNALVYRNGWQKARSGWPSWHGFPGGFGSAPALAVFLEELRAIPEVHGLSHLSLRHAGINWATDLVTVAAPVLPRKAAVTLFGEAMRRFTPEPVGLSIRSIARGKGQTVSAELWHPDLYAATAEVAVLGIEAILDGRSNRFGTGFLWEWDQDEDFRRRLGERGFHFGEHVSESERVEDEYKT